MNRKEITDLYIRVCRDSGWQLEYVEAAKMAASVAKISPLQVWDAVGTLGAMFDIAKGLHPACGQEVAA